MLELEGLEGLVVYDDADRASVSGKIAFRFFTQF